MLPEGCMTAGHARRLTRVTRYRSPASCTGARPAAAPAHPATTAPPAAAEARAIDSGFQAFWPRRASVAAALPPDAVPLRTRAADPHATSHSRIGDPAANSTAQGQGSVEQPHLTRCNVKSSSAGAAAASAAALAVSCAVRRSASRPAAPSSSAPCSATATHTAGRASQQTGTSRRCGCQASGVRKEAQGFKVS